MKKTIILAMLLAVCSLGNAQAYRSPNVKASTSTTLDSVVTAYLAGDMVRDLTANRITLITQVTQRNNSNFNGWIQQVKITVDSIFAGGFTVYALNDTVGVGALLTANNGIAQMRDSMAAHLIGCTTVQMATLGTYAGGARKSFGESALWFHPYSLVAPNKNIYWVVVVNDAWTPAKSCKFTLEAYMGAE